MQDKSILLFNKIRVLRILLYTFYLKIFWKIFFGDRVRIGKNANFDTGTYVRFNKDVTKTSYFHLGDSTRFRQYCQIKIGHNGYVHIGKHSFFNDNCSLNARIGITIGDNCMCGNNVMFYDQNHRFNFRNVPIRSQGYIDDKITIGNNCWLGANVVVLKGVTIGDNCVVGANCVVNQDLPKDSMLFINTEGQYTVSKIRFKEKAV